MKYAAASVPNPIEPKDWIKIKQTAAATQTLIKSLVIFALLNFHLNRSTNYIG